MKKITPIISIMAISLSLLFSSCITVIAKEIKGDGKLVTKIIHISKFSKIEIETKVEVNFSQEKNTGKLEFTIDQNLWEYYDIHTKGNVLHIKLRDEYKRNINLNPTQSVITVSSEQLDEIEIAGSSKLIFCTPFTSGGLSIELAGSGKVIANKYPVKIETCSMEIAGSGNILLAGSIQQTEIEIAGSGKVKALECEMAQLSVEIAGSGEVEAQVAEKLDVEIAGSGKVHYKGDPKINFDIAGSGKVKKL
jgi:hypothetical protein